uniref:Uncharacterized protein n=1 Tax=Oryza brachyantha TaxID=4533 RepID=J3MFA2_ORYBR
MARRSGARLLAVQLLIVLVVLIFIASGLLVVPTAAKSGSAGSSGNLHISADNFADKAVGSPTIHRTGIVSMHGRATGGD